MKTSIRRKEKPPPRLVGLPTLTGGPLRFPIPPGALPGSVRIHVQHVPWPSDVPGPEKGGDRISLEIYEAGGPLTAGASALKSMWASAQGQELGPRQAVHHPWGNGSYGGVIFLEDSFILLETWPDKKYLKAIVDLCNFRRQNAERAHSIALDILRLFTTPRSYVRWLSSAHGP